MKGAKVKSVLLRGKCLEDHLFKVAIQFAELGLNVWFVSPTQVEKLPANLKVPEKEILKLITFLYIKTNTELLKQINNIHGWHRFPNVIICNKYNIYVDLLSEGAKAAFITSSLLDSAHTCAKRHDLSYLICAFECENDSYQTALQNLIDLYFNIVIEATDDEDVVVSDIINSLVPNFNTV